jgi:hypothetical protein
MTEDEEKEDMTAKLSAELAELKSPRLQLWREARCSFAVAAEAKADAKARRISTKPLTSSKPKA